MQKKRYERVYSDPKSFDVFEKVEKSLLPSAAIVTVTITRKPAEVRIRRSVDLPLGLGTDSRILNRVAPPHVNPCGVLTGPRARGCGTRCTLAR